MVAAEVTSIESEEGRGLCLRDGERVNFEKRPFELLMFASARISALDIFGWAATIVCRVYDGVGLRQIAVDGVGFVGSYVQQECSRDSSIVVSEQKVRAGGS